MRMIYVICLVLIVAATYAAFSMFYVMLTAYSAVLIPSLAIAAACLCLVME